MHGADRPVVGDLVFDTDIDMDNEAEAKEYALEPAPETDEKPEEVSTTLVDESAGKPSKRSRKPWEAPKVKTLTEDDLGKYSIFDVIMPLPGRDVAFPGGPLGEKYKEFLVADGLDPDNFERKQKYESLFLRS